jgi:hypothetical protein
MLPLPPSRTIEAVAPLCASGPYDVKTTAASQIAIADPAATGHGAKERRRADRQLIGGEEE